MTRYLPLSLLFLFAIPAHATLIRGKIANGKGEFLPFATVMIKGTTQGTTANAEGLYQLDVPQGSHVIVCQYMGYRKEEKTVQAGSATLELNFVLQPLSMQIKEVVVRSGGEDPAYAIIRQAIKKRSFYQSQVKNYSVESYIKMLARLRKT